MREGSSSISRSSRKVSLRGAAGAPADTAGSVPRERGLRPAAAAGGAAAAPRWRSQSS